MDKLQPIASMYGTLRTGIFTYIWLIFMVNVGIYTIHGSYGVYLPTFTRKNHGNSTKCRQIYYTWLLCAIIHVTSLTVVECGGMKDSWTRNRKKRFPMWNHLRSLNPNEWLRFPLQISVPHVSNIAKNPNHCFQESAFLCSRRLQPVCIIQVELQGLILWRKHLRKYSPEV